MSIKMSLYHNGKDTQGQAHTVEELFALHTDKSVRARWEECRRRLTQDGADSDGYRNAKLMMPAVTNAGVFEEYTRKDIGLIEPSGLVQVEVDKLADEAACDAILQRWTARDATLWCAKSISWKGVFAFVKVTPAPTDAASYKAAYAQVREVYANDLTDGAELDDTVNNISRLRFIGYDPQAYLNMDCNEMQVSRAVRTPPKRDKENEDKRVNDWRSKALIPQGARNSVLAARAGSYVSSPERPSIQQAQDWAIQQNEEYCTPPMTLSDMEGLLHTSIPAWVEKRDSTIWITNEKGGIRASNQQNAYLALQEMGYTIQRNEFANTVVVDGEPYHEDMLKSLAVDIARHYSAEAYSPSNAIIDTALIAMANENIINPQRDWLEGLKFHGGFQQSEVCHFLGVKDTELNFEIFKLLLRGMISRVYQPGCKFDYMPVLIGKQGVGKSSLMTLLAGDDMHTDSFSMNAYDIRKALVEQSRGKWLIEFQEFGALRGDKIEDLKGLISSTEDNIRLPYGRAATQIKRAFVLVATTNSQALFSDTYNRRHPVLQVREGAAIDLDYFRVMREKLFAWIINDYQPPEAHITLPKHLWAEAEAETHQFKHTTAFFEFAEELYQQCEVKGKTWIRSLDVQKQLKAARIVVQDKQCARDMQAAGFTRRRTRGVASEKSKKLQRLWVTGDFEAGHQQQLDRSGREILGNIFPEPR